MKPRKLESLQVLRAVAAVLVIWFHAIRDVSDTGLQVPYASFGNLRQVGACGVDVFFVLSGLVVSLSAARKQSAGWFAVRRIVRIYPLYWISLIAFYVLHRADQAQNVGGSMIRTVWSATLLPSPLRDHPVGRPIVPNAWTLVFEVFFYGCLAVGLMLDRKDARNACAALVVGIVLLNLALPVKIPFVAYYGSFIVLEFLFGIVIGRLLAALQERPKLARALAYGGGLLLTATAFVYLGEIYVIESMFRQPALAATRIVCWGVPAALLVAGCAASPWSSRGPVGRAVVYVGDACYSIYILQWLPMPFLAAACARWIGPLARGGEIAVFVVTVMTTLFGVLAFRFLESPMTGYLNARLRPRRTVAEPASVA